MDHLIDVSTKITWPGAFVLIVLILAVTAVVISLFGDWPKLITINKTESKVAGRTEGA